jgi:hypothetical protein
MYTLPAAKVFAVEELGLLRAGALDDVRATAQ